METDSWTFAKLVSEGLLEIGDGYRARNDELGGDGPIFLRAGHVRESTINFEGVERFHSELSDRVASKMSKPGDTIVTTKGNGIGRTGFVTPDLPGFVYSPHLSYWRSLAPERLAPGFLRYWAQSDVFRHQLRGMQASTDMAPYLSLTDQARLRIDLPSALHQYALAAILGALDDKIELNRRMNETLEGIARALFYETYRSAGGEDRRVHDLVRDQLLMIGDGYRAKRSELSNEGLPFARAGNINGGFRFDNAELLGREGVAKAGTKRSQPGDVVFTSKGTVGRFALVAETTTPFVYSPQLCFWRALKPERLQPSFLFSWMQSRQFVDQVSAVKGQTDMADYVSLRDQLAMAVFVPDPGVQERFAEQADPIRQKQAANVAQSAILAALRDTLLPKLLSGELRIKDAEKIVGEAT